MKRMLSVVLIFSAGLFCPVAWSADIVRGSWNLETTSLKPNGNPHLLLDAGTKNPIYVHLDDADSNGRGYQHDYTVPPDQIVDHLDNDKIACMPDVVKSDGCAFAVSSLTKLGDRLVRWNASNTGGRCGFELGIYVKDLQNVLDAGPTATWVEDRTFMVEIPTQVTSATVVGTLDGNAIQFSPSDPLSDDDKKHFQLISKTQVPSQNPILTRYVFKVLKQ